MMRLRLHPEAMVELAEAIEFHERERVGYGALLFDEVTRRVGQAARFPRSGTAVTGFAGHYDVRQFALQRFRYLVVVAVIRDERFVVALAHTSRRPGYWRDRIK
jgi:toxin ParE1/3/4